MHPPRPKVQTVDEYIALFSGPAQQKLKQLRAIITAAAPKAEEGISYSIPAYKLHGWLVYFSGYAKHVSVSFPPRNVFATFASELAPYKYSKSTVQFPLDQPLPAELITNMVRYKIKENQELEAQKAKR